MKKRFGEEFKVLVAFKQRRCFSRLRTCKTGKSWCWSLSNSEGVSPKSTRSSTRWSSTRWSSTRCWSLSNSEGVSPGNGHSDEQDSGVLVAFKQRRCFSKNPASLHNFLDKGVGRFQTAKVFLPTAMKSCAPPARGVGRFQTAKVFLQTRFG